MNTEPVGDESINNWWTDNYGQRELARGPWRPRGTSTLEGAAVRASCRAGVSGRRSPTGVAQ